MKPCLPADSLEKGHPLGQAMLAALAAAPGADALPRVSHFELAPARSAEGRGNNFAALVLDDGSIGLTYVALDDALAQLRRQLASPEFSLTGQSVLKIARYFLGEPGWQRALGLAAVNAASQVLLGREGSLQPMPSTVPMLDLQAGDHVGMVGHFGRLLDPIRAAGGRLTVIELDPSLVREENQLVVTLDPGRLTDCNKVIITGTTLLNDSLDNILSYCANAAQVNLLGPSASCLGQPLFARGVTRVGGFHATNSEQFLSLWRAGAGWRDAGMRYQLCA